MREPNATDVTDSILYTSSPDDLDAISTSMTSTYNETSTAYVELAQESENNQRVWNLSKTAVTSLFEPTTMPFDTAGGTTTMYTPTTTSDSFDEFGPPEGVEYIFVPLGVVVSVIILSAVVWVAISLLSLPRDVFLPPPFWFFSDASAVQVQERQKENLYNSAPSTMCIRFSMSEATVLLSRVQS